jgi:ribosomal protein S18 acetylase RimI-like enzyme
MKLIAATDADAGLVYDIKLAAYREYAVLAYGSWDEALQRRVTGGNLPVTRLIVVAEKIIGWVAASCAVEEDEIIDLHILPEHQRKGYGQEVVRRVIAEASNAGKPVVLHVLKVNPARALYERYGFVKIGETATHTIMKRPNQPLQHNDRDCHGGCDAPAAPATVVADL